LDKYKDSNTPLWLMLAGCAGLGVYVYHDYTEKPLFQKESPLNSEEFIDFKLKRVEQYNHNTASYVSLAPSCSDASHNSHQLLLRTSRKPSISSPCRVLSHCQSLRPRSACGQEGQTHHPPLHSCLRSYAPWRTRTTCQEVRQWKCI